MAFGHLRCLAMITGARDWSGRALRRNFVHHDASVTGKAPLLGWDSTCDGAGSGLARRGRARYHAGPQFEIGLRSFKPSLVAASEQLRCIAAIKLSRQQAVPVGAGGLQLNRFLPSLRASRQAACKSKRRCTRRLSRGQLARVGTSPLALLLQSRRRRRCCGLVKDSVSDPRRWGHVGESL